MERNISDFDLQSIIINKYKKNIKRLNRRNKDRRISINSVIDPFLDNRKNNADRRNNV